ncbi:MAG TPA: apolipoprotein N-acyltransferase [Xanthobacteraceae bacterium]|jgi:apolipoprotein N-acyltransferase
MFTRVAHSIVLAWGWKRALIAFAAGAITALGLPPFDIWPAPFLTFPVLVWLLDGCGAGSFGTAFAAAGIGWWFGFGYFLAGLYWIGYAFLVDARTFGWLLPFAVVALPAYLAVYTALGAALARLLWTAGALRILALAGAFTAAEWLRGHLLTGFPWNAFGYLLATPLPIAQAASLIGLWGLTFVAILVYASPAVIADDRAESSYRWAAPGLAILLVVSMTGYGAMRLAGAPTALVEGVRLRIMQPNLQQDEKFKYSQKQQVMDRYVALSERGDGSASAGLTGVTHLIWPESAFPFFLTREPSALAQIAMMLPPQTVLITGAVRAPEIVPTAAITRAYNSIYVIDHTGSPLSVYDKVHLVPFGEYLPFQDFLERLGLTQLTKLRGGFLSGARRRPLAIPGAADAVPLLCYEAIFPGAIMPAGDRPGWMLNLTNDGWFGASPGPYQHLAQARMRAIEEGLPLVRAANTGISAVIDPLGRIVRSLPLGVEDVLDSPLPAPLPPTAYARLGDLPAAGMVTLAFILIFWKRGRRTKPTKPRYIGG